MFFMAWLAMQNASDGLGVEFTFQITLFSQCTSKYFESNFFHKFFFQFVMKLTVETLLDDNF
jgi:hypothetical protein